MEIARDRAGVAQGRDRELLRRQCHDAPVGKVDIPREAFIAALKVDV